MSESTERPILIAGGGPVGLACALELARHGVASVVIEADGRVANQIAQENARRRELRSRDWLALADELAADGVTAVAVAYLFSFLEPAHEQRTRELIRARHPRLAVSLSSEVDPAFREYERTLVTVFDAYIKPVVDGYLDHLEAGDFIDDFLEGFPSVRREQVIAVLEEFRKELLQPARVNILLDENPD